MKYNYHRTQIDLTCNSNHMESSRLTHEQTRYIFETNTIGLENEVLNVDDVIETVNHFRCIDRVIDCAQHQGRTLDKRRRWNGLTINAITGTVFEWKIFRDGVQRRITLGREKIRSGQDTGKPEKL